MKKISKKIKNPRITEKASVLIEKDNAFVFDVEDSINKTEIKKAIFDIFKIKPVKVNILQTPTKFVFSKGKKGKKSGGKKAIVYLKKGDKIEFV